MESHYKFDYVNDSINSVTIISTIITIINIFVNMVMKIIAYRKSSHSLVALISIVSSFPKVFVNSLWVSLIPDDVSSISRFFVCRFCSIFEPADVL